MRALLSAALALLLFPTAPAAEPSPAPDVLIPTSSRVTAPDFTLTDVQGRPLSLSHDRGRVVLLDFWATTCGGCKIEVPWYVAFDTMYRDKGLSVLGLDMYGETPAVIRPFMAQWKMNYPVAVGTDALGESYHLREMPLTLLIDRSGKIALAHAGVVDRAGFEKGIQELLRQGS